MSPAKAPAPKPDETREMLSMLPPSMFETFVTIVEGGRVKARSYPRAEIDRAVADLAPAQGKANCYFEVNQSKPEALNRKAKKEDIAQIRMLHVDIDHKDAEQSLRAFRPPPSLAIHSGGGVQGFWFLDGPVADIDYGEQLNKAIANQLGGDKCHNADRIMRLAGTLNVPNAKKRAAGREVALAYIIRDLTDPSRRYSVKEMEEALGAQASGLPAIGYPPANVMLPVRFDELPVRVSEFTLALIRDGDHLERPIGSAGATYPSRSEPVFRVANDLARAGADETVIVSVLTNPANRISASILERRDPAAYAAKQARAGLRTAGNGWPNVTKSGQPLATFANALVALPRLGFRFEFDKFKNRKRVNSATMEELVGELTDDICASIRAAVLHEWNLDLGKNHVHDAAHTLCLENTVHPVLEYLEGLIWDGQPRVERWLTTYLGADENPLHLAIGRLVLIAAVRRVRQPGVKFDSIMVLEGPQGSGKSTAVCILAGEEHFSDQEILTLDTKGQMEAIEGVWIFEVSELQGISIADSNKVKAFASRRFDRARQAYARFLTNRPRQTIFIGTTNDDQYLRDRTGNRRFWPVRTGQIDLEGLRRDRNQLWAEAAYLEAQGGSLVLPNDLWALAAQAQDARLLDDPWQDLLHDAKGFIEGGVERISSAEVMKHLEVMVGQQTPSSIKRIGPLMRNLGWSGPKQLRIRGGNQRGYERPAAGAADSPPPVDYDGLF